jgi:hypothetical protein
MPYADAPLAVYHRPEVPETFLTVPASAIHGPWNSERSPSGFTVASEASP